jgi:outer membrane protein assembly factor BamE (lipoprotein component of BamABCDE complex)
MTLRSTSNSRPGTGSRQLRLPVLLAVPLLAFALSGCVVATAGAWHQAHLNQANIDRVAMGQTTAQVAAVMGHGPERREARVRFDGKSVEEWHYMTDVVRKRDTTITFLDDHVVEIRTTPWADVD